MGGGPQKLGACLRRCLLDRRLHSQPYALAPHLHDSANTDASPHPHRVTRVRCSLDPRPSPRLSPAMPHTQSAAELLELGKAFYRERNYERALKAFMEVSGRLDSARYLADQQNQAFGASKSDDVKFLDMAVACQIKLADLNSALSVGRKMTKHAAKDARGYLRMGQVLQLQEKPEMALEVYKLGLRRCATEDPDKIRVCIASTTTMQRDADTGS